MAYTYTPTTSTVITSTGAQTIVTPVDSDSATGSDGTVTSVISNAQSSSIERYSDLNLQMIPHPQKRDVLPVIGEQAVKNAIRTLLLTNFMERPFQPTMGANLRSLLFEPNDAVTRLALKDAVRNVLQKHEPRIENINVVIEATNNENAYRITVVFSIKENDSVQDIEINLRRLR
jgi:phage baseplate assembly protein W